MQWNEEAFQEWKDPQLPCREEPIEEHQDVNQGLFEMWLSCSSTIHDVQYEQPFPMASKLMSILISNGYQQESSRWFCFLGLLADIRQKPILRVAESISSADVSYLVYMHDCEHYAAEHDQSLDYVTFRQLPFEQWHDATKNIVIELCSIRLQVVDNENHVHVSCTEDQPASTDDADRLEIVADLLSTADKQKTLSASDKKMLPRIDAPFVEDSFEQAVKEDTPGYIACAFPKLFPFGTGDYHSSKGSAIGKLDFASWGKYVMQYHDQRFMRHNRFRYFFLNTWLRMKTPGIRSVFWKIHSELGDLRLEHLQDNALRKKIVQQMTTATANIPGSLGEKRHMRQCLEAMVDQKEQETADIGENMGRGRLPSGFCTLTCAVYRWSCLHDVILQSYDQKDREQWLAWKTIEDISERELKKREVYYRLALQNPGIVAWFCALKLEMMVHLTVKLLSRNLAEDVVPGKSQAMCFGILWFNHFKLSHMMFLILSTCINCNLSISGHCILSARTPGSRRPRDYSCFMHDISLWQGGRLVGYV
jgi:hypothetical protein